MPGLSKARVHDASIDFSRLNAAERTVLDLLAQGHTAKSIATITDRSVGSVNERLREARRKTGVGSSRELARLLAAQENRDELIGMAEADDRAPDSAMPATTGTAVGSSGLCITCMITCGSSCVVAVARWVITSGMRSGDITDTMLVRWRKAASTVAA